jgi:hypothetical protein
MTILFWVLSLLTIQVSPVNLMEGGTVRIMCRVEPHADNRTIEAGVGEYMRSARQLDGADSKRTFEFWFKSVPCGTGQAFCVVYQTRGRTTIQQRALTVAGCER